MSAITVTQINGNSLVITTEDFLYATDNGSGANIIIENIQTNVKSIQVTESLSDLESLDSTLIILTQISPSQEIVLNTLRVKTVEDLRTFRRVGYEGAGSSNKLYDVSETLSDIIMSLNDASVSNGFDKVATLTDLDLADIAGQFQATYLPGRDGKNVSQVYAVMSKSNDADTYSGSGLEAGSFLFHNAPFASYDSGFIADLIYGQAARQTGFVSLGVIVLDITNETFGMQIDTPISQITPYRVNVDFYALKAV